jgi:hypothetical protein
VLITEADDCGFGAPEKSVHDCSIGDYYLARHLLETTEYCGYGSVLAVNDGVLTTFNACDDYGRKFGPIEVLNDVPDIRGAASTNLTLITLVDYQGLTSSQCKVGAGPGEYADGFTNRLISSGRTWALS